MVGRRQAVGQAQVGQAQVAQAQAGQAQVAQAQAGQAQVAQAQAGQAQAGQAQALVGRLQAVAAFKTVGSLVTAELTLATI